MQPLEIILQRTWQGLEVKLATITTTNDNEYLSSKDIAAYVDLPKESASKYIKDNDILLLSTTETEFDSHAYLYNRKITSDKLIHTFTPISEFLKKETITTEKLNDVEIIGKLLCSFKNLSETINFKTINN
jgi:hypothetical protein